MKNFDAYTCEELYRIPHPSLRHHMPLSAMQRAAQFAPFAAVRGQDEAVAETARRTQPFREISEELRARLDVTLQEILAQEDSEQQVEICYFIPDEKKDGGRYETICGEVVRYEDWTHTVCLADGRRIATEQIWSMRPVIE